jgi:acetylcholinesterase
MMFATHQDYRSTSTEFEFEVSKAMEDHLLAFMKDPVNEPASLGWKSYAEGGMLRFGAEGKVVPNCECEHGG